MNFRTHSWRTSSTFHQEQIKMPLNNSSSASNLIVREENSVANYFDVTQKLDVSLETGNFAPPLPPVTSTSISKAQPFQYFKSAHTGMTALHDDASRRKVLLSQRPSTVNNDSNKENNKHGKPTVRVGESLKRKVGRPAHPRIPVQPSEAVQRLFLNLNKANLLTAYNKRHSKTVATRQITFRKNGQMRHMKSFVKYTAKEYRKEVETSYLDCVLPSDENLSDSSQVIEECLSEGSEEVEEGSEEVEEGSDEVEEEGSDEVGEDFKVSCGRNCNETEDFKTDSTEESGSIETVPTESQRTRLVTKFRRLRLYCEEDSWAVVHSTVEDVLKLKLAAMMKKTFENPKKKLDDLSVIKMESDLSPSSSSDICLQPVFLFPISLNKIESFAIVPFENSGKDLQKEADWKISGILFTPRNVK